VAHVLFSIRLFTDTAAACEYLASGITTHGELRYPQTQRFKCSSGEVQLSRGITPAPNVGTVSGDEIWNSDARRLGKNRPGLSTATAPRRSAWADGSTGEFR